MRTISTLFLLSALMWGYRLTAQPCSCGGQRYVHALFGKTSLGTNVQYTQNMGMNFDGTTEHERMDIWGPANDNCNKRPLIIWVHGGGFAQQDKSAPDVVAMCDSFARHGFVTASIDYRDDYWGPYGPVNDYSQNPTPWDNSEFTRADYRAMQDAKCAVRYFKANAGLYGIDTNYIFMGGTSAGAWTSLMVAYLDKPSEKPAEAYQQSSIYQYTRPDLGSIDGSGGWNMCSSRVKAIIDCWGALPDTSYIDGPNDPAAIIFHEYGDPVVNYYYGPPFQGQYPNFNSYWGTHYVSMQMNAVGVPHSTFPLNGSQHSLYPYRGQVTTEVSLFLDSIICTNITTAVTTVHEAPSLFTVHPNPSPGMFYLETNVEQGEVQVTDLAGGEILSLEVSGGTTAIDLTGKDKGVYFVRFSTGTKTACAKLILAE